MRRQDTRDRPDRAAVSAHRGHRYSRALAAERRELEVVGRNWSARHVADLVGLSELTVKRMARQGKLPAVKVGRAWQFPPDKVRAWYAGQPVTPPRRPGARRR